MKLATATASASFIQIGRRSERDSETRYLAFTPKGILNSPAVTKMDFWSINPYIGCEFGCAYCYARDTHRWAVDRALRAHGAGSLAGEIASLDPAEAFERRVIAKENAAQLLAAVLPRTKVGAHRIMIGTATDPYQPAERRFELTRTILEVFRRHEGLRIGVITKSALIARDTDLLAELSRRHDVVINISLASFDARLLRRIEPRTPVPRARLRTMKTLADAGLNVGLLAAPVLPGITDGERGLRALVEAAVASGAKWAECHPLRMGPATRATLLPWLSRHRPRLLARYQLHYGDRVMANAQYSDALEHRFRTICEQAGLSGRRRTDPVAPQKDLWAQG